MHAAPAPAGSARIAHLVLLLLVAAVYANALGNGFVWDDHLFFTGQRVELGVRDVLNAFSGPLWNAADLPDQGANTYYRPLASVSTLIGLALWGPTPIGFHLFGLALHLASAVLLYRVVLLLHGHAPAAFVAAALFAVHPVHNEPLGRPISNDVLVGFFVMLTVYCFLRRSRLASWAAFAAALLSKEIAVMLPLALLAAAVMEDGGRKGLARTLPFVALTLPYLAARFWVLDAPLGESSNREPIVQLLTMATAAADYLRLLVVPFPLSPFYPAEWHASIREPKVLLSVLGLSALALLAWRLRRNQAVMFGLVFAVVMLVPAVVRVNSFPVGFDRIYIAERYLYVSVMAFCIAVSALLQQALAGNAGRWVLGAAWCVVAVFALYSVQANRFWKDDLALAKRMVDDRPHSAFAQFMLAFVEDRQGRTADAIAHIRRALAIQPREAALHNHLGLFLRRMGRLDEAIQEFRMAARLGVSSSVMLNLGATYDDKGLYEEAVRALRHAVRLSPAWAQARRVLGLVHYNHGRHVEALAEFDEALRLAPHLVDAMIDTGNAHFQLARYDDAIRSYRAAIARAPGIAHAHNNLGFAYLRAGLIEQGVQALTTALALDPGLTQAKSELQRLGRRP